MNPVKSDTSPKPENGAAACQAPNSGAAFTFAHLSDPHLSSLEGVEVRDLLNKRMLGYLSWRLHRRAEHRPEVLAALVRDLRTFQPEHVVITGDLTHLGLPEEFREVSRWLQGLGSPAQVTVVPGNHDAYVSTPWERTFALWAPYMLSDAAVPSIPAAAEGAGAFPSLRIRGPVAFIGLSTARPSAPFYAVGSLGQTQLRRLEALLGETDRQALCRVMLIHHPPLPDTVHWRKRLTDSGALRSLLAEHRVELVLHGHAHYAARSHLDTAAGSAPVIGIPSASALGHKPGRRAQYCLYRLTRQDRGWHLHITVRGYSGAQDCFVLDAESELVLPGPVEGGLPG